MQRRKLTNKHLLDRGLRASVAVLLVVGGSCFADPGLPGQTEPEECPAGDCEMGTGTSGGDGETGTDETGEPTPACGNGQVEPGEECDMGIFNGAGGPCTILCTDPACGDGMVQPGKEECDDANTNDGDGCRNDCSLPSCGDGVLDMGEECDEGADNGATGECHSDCAWDFCGDGLVGPEEQCDDGNADEDDGCTTSCSAPAGCSPSAELLEFGPGGIIALCQDPDHLTCEEDFADLCADGWELCTPLQHAARNDGWVFDMGGRSALGAIRCRSSGGAGHYTVAALANETPDNCLFGSSRAECPSNFGCTEKQEYAMCCAPTETCGNGVVDSAEEECDDGNQNELDDCLSDCRTRNSNGTYCG
jgi:cysteine-rich repeat protein